MGFDRDLYLQVMPKGVLQERKRCERTVPGADLEAVELESRQAQKVRPARGSCRSNMATLAKPSSPSAHVSQQHESSAGSD